MSPLPDILGPMSADTVDLVTRNQSDIAVFGAEAPFAFFDFSAGAFAALDSPSVAVACIPVSSRSCWPSKAMRTSEGSTGIVGLTTPSQ